MTSAAWNDRGDSSPGVRPVAVSSGRRLAPVVYDLLKDRLLEGEYQSGERLSVESLKAEFGVSKQPVMEALRRLSSEGLVEIIPQVGCRVPVYDGADVTDFFAIFGGMEGAVAGVAAQRCTDAQVDQLADVNEEIRRLIDEPDPAARSPWLPRPEPPLRPCPPGMTITSSSSAPSATVTRPPPGAPWRTKSPAP
jgi:DNA-binding transcriptional MocR family regulator